MIVTWAIDISFQSPRTEMGQLNTYKPIYWNENKVILELGSWVSQDRLSQIRVVDRTAGFGIYHGAWYVRRWCVPSAYRIPMSRRWAGSCWGLSSCLSLKLAPRLLPSRPWGCVLCHRSSGRWLSGWALLVMTGASGFWGQFHRDQKLCVAAVCRAFCAHNSPGCVLPGQLDKVICREEGLAVLRNGGWKLTRTVCSASRDVVNCITNLYLFC